MPAKKPRDQFVSLATAAKMLGMQKAYFYKLVQRGKVKTYKSGRWYEVSLAWVQEFGAWRRARQEWMLKHPMPVNGR